MPLSPALHVSSIRSQNCLEDLVFVLRRVSKRRNGEFKIDTRENGSSEQPLQVPWQIGPAMPVYLEQDIQLVDGKFVHNVQENVLAVR